MHDNIMLLVGERGGAITLSQKRGGGRTGGEWVEPLSGAKHTRTSQDHTQIETTQIETTQTEFHVSSKDLCSEVSS